jgi:hypothetical protein
VSWVPSAVSASPALVSSSSMLMVTITDAGAPPTVGWSSAFNSRVQASSSASWSRCTWGAFIRNLDDGAGFVFESCAAWCGERIQDRVQLSTNRVGEPALQQPHAVAALVEFQIPPVLLQLVIDRFRAVRIGSSHYRLGEPVQLRRRRGKQLLRRLDGCWVETGPGECVQGPLHNLYLGGTHHTIPLQRRQPRQ